MDTPVGRVSTVAPDGGVNAELGTVLEKLVISTCPALVAT
jgi:hypothetical protein